MKIDIENKILIPFIVLLVLSVLTMSAVSYYNTYNMLLNNEIENRKNYLDEVGFFISSKDNEIDNQAEFQKYIVNYYKNSDTSNFIIANSNEILLSTSYIKEDWTENLVADTSQDSSVIYGDEYIFIYEKYNKYNKYNWVAGYYLNKSELNCFRDVKMSRSSLLDLPKIALYNVNR